MVRVLVANIPLPQNRFLVDLNAELAQMYELVHSSDAFWNMQGDYDFIHLHFPEYLTYEIERAYINGLTPELIDAVEERLRFWASRARIIVTRHVLFPHDAAADPAWEAMYETVYRYADGVVHFAGPSIDEFRQRYSKTAFHRGTEPLHAIVPHHNYGTLKNEIGREEARRKLGLAKDAPVVLVFGAIRNSAEQDLVVNMFKALGAKKKVLLVSRWRERLSDVSWIRLKYWIRDAVRLYYRIHPSYHLNYGFIEEDDTQLYLNAADVLFIPRFRVLNSGNITLGMTFGRVVVGPDVLDVGSLLRDHGNPVFNPDQPHSAVTAVERGLELAKAGKVGRANREVALSEWTPRQCADLYAQFFQQVDSGLATTR
ncbi:MAG: hypothetical protein ABI556_09515 [Gemmatimonadales bacterium]